MFPLELIGNCIVEFRISQNRSLRTAARRYGGIVASCRNAVSGRVPLALALLPSGTETSADGCPASSFASATGTRASPLPNLLLVQSTLPVEAALPSDASLAGVKGTRSRRGRFAVCVTPLNLHYDRPARLVELLEFNRVLGAGVCVCPFQLPAACVTRTTSRIDYTLYNTLYCTEIDLYSYRSATS